MSSQSAKIKAQLTEVAQSFEKLADWTPQIDQAADMLIKTLRAGGKVMFCGNGGSAADSQHLAAELMGRYMRDRAPLPALSLTTDTSALTAIGNDYGYEQVFSRQLRGVGKSGDALVAISTSGNSKNVIAAIETAKQLDIRTVGMTGSGGGTMAGLCDLCLCVPAARTDFTQQMHITIGHIICGLVEDALC